MRAFARSSAGVLYYFRESYDVFFGCGEGCGEADCASMRVYALPEAEAAFLAYLCHLLIGKNYKLLVGGRIDKELVSAGSEKLL